MLPYGQIFSRLQESKPGADPSLVFASPVATTRAGDPGPFARREHTPGAGLGLGGLVADPCNALEEPCLSRKAGNGGFGPSAEPLPISEPGCDEESLSALSDVLLSEAITDQQGAVRQYRGACGMDVQIVQQIP